MNNSERSDWIDNDEGLYILCKNWMRRNTGGRRKFIQEHRELIDSVIGNVCSGRQPASYLAYGGNPVRPLF